MKIKEILNTTVDIFYSTKQSSRPAYQQSLNYFLSKIAQKQKSTIFKLREINKTDEKAAKQYKKENLPCCTISATFDQYRRLNCIKKRTGLITIDIDKDKNPELDVEKAKIEIIRYPFIALTMLSCRGEGIWCLIPYNAENDFRETWNALREDFLKIGYIIDDNCKDETRLRYVSWDDNILINQNVEVYNKTKEFYKSNIVKESNNQNVDNKTVEYSEDNWELTKDNVKDIVVAVYLLTHYCGYTADDYNDWLLDGFRLATIPNTEIGLRLFKWISEASNNYEGDADVEDKFEECCNTTTYRTNILGYYINQIKEYYGADWRIKANQLLGKHIII